MDPETQQLPLCLWVNGRYEDQVYSGTDPIQSTLVPTFGLTPAAIFA